MTARFEKARSAVHSKFLTMRNLDALLDSSDFKEAFESASEEEKCIAESLIEKERYEELRKWMMDRVRAGTEYGDWSMGDLRKLAVRLGVAGYGRLKKPQLILGIQQRERIIHDSRSSSSDVQQATSVHQCRDSTEGVPGVRHLVGDSRSSSPSESSNLVGRVSSEAG